MRAGVLQTCSGIDPAANAAMLADGIAGLAADGAEVVFTPEMSGLVDRDRDRAAASVCSEKTDAVLAAIRRAAVRDRVWVSLGSLAIRPATGGRLVNRSYLIDPAGAIVARYDKIHLFDVVLAAGESYRESATYAPGAAAVVAATPWGPLGLTICYDVRFPSLYADLADAGAVVITVPAAFTRPTGTAHWHTLVRARAIETGAYVVAAAQSGVHQDGRATFGHSLVVDPWGVVVLDMGEETGAAVVDLDLDLVATTRTRLPALAARRPFRRAALTMPNGKPMDAGHAPVAQPDRATVS